VSVEFALLDDFQASTLSSTGRMVLTQANERLRAGLVANQGDQLRPGAMAEIGVQELFTCYLPADEAGAGFTSLPRPT